MFLMRRLIKKRHFFQMDVTVVCSFGSMGPTVKFSGTLRAPLLNASLRRNRLDTLSEYTPSKTKGGPQVHPSPVISLHCVLLREFTHLGATQWAGRPKSDHTCLPNSTLRGRAEAGSRSPGGVFSPTKSTKTAHRGLFYRYFIEYLG